MLRQGQARAEAIFRGYARLLLRLAGEPAQSAAPPYEPLQPKMAYTSTALTTGTFEAAAREFGDDNGGGTVRCSEVSEGVLSTPPGAPPDTTWTELHRGIRWASRVPGGDLRLRPGSTGGPGAQVVKGLGSGSRGPTLLRPDNFGCSFACVDDRHDDHRKALLDLFCAH